MSLLLFFLSFLYPRALIFSQNSEIPCYQWRSLLYIPRHVCFTLILCAATDQFQTCLSEMTLGCVVLLVKGAGCIALVSSAYHKRADIPKPNKCEQSDIPGCRSHERALFSSLFFFFFKVWDNSYFLSGFDWLSEEAVSYKLPSPTCFCSISS